MANTRTEIHKNLFSTKKETVLETIKKLRETGSNKDLAILAELFSKTEDEEIQKSIYGLFCDLRNQESSEPMVRLLQTTSHKPTLKMLVSSCWQTRLNYIDNFEIFIDMVIHENFEIAFEAFTMIESFEEKTSEARKKDLIGHVKNNISECKEENLAFAMDMTKIIEEYKV